VNVGALHHRDRRGDEIRRVMQERVERVLGVAAHAWARGAGAGRVGMRGVPERPGADCRTLPDRAGRAVSRAFTHVVFAVLDSSGKTLGAFEQVFGPAALKGKQTRRR